MPKCHTCKGCVEHKWIENLHFWWCFLCRKYYVIRHGVLVEVDPQEELRKFKESLK